MNGVVRSVRCGITVVGRSEPSIKCETSYRIPEGPGVYKELVIDSSFLLTKVFLESAFQISTNARRYLRLAARSISNHAPLS